MQIHFSFYVDGYELRYFCAVQKVFILDHRKNLYNWIHFFLLVGEPICVGLYQLEFHYAWAHPIFDIDKWDEFHLSWLTLSVQEYTALTNNSWQKINEIRVLQTVTKCKDHCVRSCYVRSYTVFYAVW